MGMERRRSGGRSNSNPVIREARFEKVNPDINLEDVDVNHLDEEGNLTEEKKKLSAKERRILKKAQKEMEFKFDSYPYLAALKPREKYVFHSDYFQVDNRFCTIMSFFHIDGSVDNFGAFWGVNRVPAGLGQDIEIILFEQTRRMTEGWIESHQRVSEGVTMSNENEQANSGSGQEIGRAHV